MMLKNREPKESKRARARGRTLRLLTLVCFFHFTGLNNGFTYLVLSSGQVQGAYFAPVAVEQAARVLNPLNWKRFLLDPVFSSLFSRSGRIVRYASRIQCASQRAMESLLMESSLLEVWMKDSLMSRPGTPGTNAPNLSEADAVGPAGDADRAVLALSSVMKSKIFLEQVQKSISDAMGYLKITGCEAWIDYLRALFKDGGKYKSGFALKAGTAHGVWGAQETEQGPPLVRMREQAGFRLGLQNYLTTARSSERGSEDPAVQILTGTDSHRITPDELRGDFFVEAMS